MPRKRRKPDPAPEEPGEGDAPQEESPQPEAVAGQATCPHQSADLSQCCALGRPIADAGAALDSIRRDADRLGGAIKFQAELATPAITDELVVKLKTGVDYELHATLSRHTKQTLDVILLVREQVPAKDSGLPGQRDLFSERPAAPEPVETLVCATCQRIIRAEGQEPGGICGFCLEGELRIIPVIALVCSECKQPQELATAQVGDPCTMCKEGRYLYAGLEGQPQPESAPDILYIAPGRVAEFSDAISGASIAQERVVKVLVQIGEQQYAVTEAASADPVTFICWQAIPLSEWGDRDYHEYPGDNGDEYEGLKVTLRDEGGAPFVLEGPPVRVVAQAAEDEAEDRSEEAAADDSGEEKAD